MAATWVAVSTSTRRRAAGWASDATCRLLEWRRGGLGEELQHRGEALGWQLSCLPVPHKSCYSHKMETQQLPAPFEVLRLKSQHVVILPVHHKEDGAQHLNKRLMNLCTKNEP